MEDLWKIIHIYLIISILTNIFPLNFNLIRMLKLSMFVVVSSSSKRGREE